MCPSSLCSPLSRDQSESKWLDQAATYSPEKEPRAGSLNLNTRRIQDTAHVHTHMYTCTQAHVHTAHSTQAHRHTRTCTEQPALPHRPSLGPQEWGCHQSLYFPPQEQVVQVPTFPDGADNASRDDSLPRRAWADSLFQGPLLLSSLEMWVLGICREIHRGSSQIMAGQQWH
jgi:hypothetical protein